MGLTAAGGEAILGWGVRCAYRFRNLPYLRNINVGFLVVVRPAS